MFHNRHTDYRRGWRLLVAVVALSLLVPATAPLAAAAGGTSVSITPGEANTDVGETTTFQVVVDSAQGGVGAAEFGVAVDGNVAEITGVEVLGSGATNVEIADDGSSVDVEYAFRDTADSGSVTIAEVTVQGLSDGATGVSLEAAAGNDGVLIFDEGGVGYEVTDTNDATLTVGDEPAPEPASFQVSNLSPTDVTVTQGDVIDVSADVENTGGQAATKAVEFRVGDTTLATQEVTLGPGESTTVTFEDIDTSGLEPGEYTHGVFTEDDSATATLTVTDAGLPPVGEFDSAPTDIDGDGLYEDVNGDGTFDVVDVQALFANREDPTVQNNPDAFDFNGDGAFDVVDVQALFNALQEGS